MNCGKIRSTNNILVSGLTLGNIILYEEEVREKVANALFVLLAIPKL